MPVEISMGKDHRLQQIAILQGGPRGGEVIPFRTSLVGVRIRDRIACDGPIVRLIYGPTRSVVFVGTVIDDPAAGEVDVCGCAAEKGIGTVT
jgi:hypothetical protein